MKNKDFDIDILLKKALSSSETPDPELIKKIKSIKEDSIVKKPTIKLSLGSVAIAVLVAILITTTAFAALYFLEPSEVADKFGNQALSAAFDSETAININTSQTAGEYIFTLLAIVSGNDITDHPLYIDGEIANDRTYAVLAIQKADGSSMPSIQYGDFTPFYISPYIKGIEPWRVNSHTLNGGHSDIVIDGVMYRIIDFNEITMFADRGIYLGINTGWFHNQEAFIFNEQTGELKTNPNYEGVSVVFELPIDKELANPEKAQQFLDNLWYEMRWNEVEDINNISDEELRAGIKIYEYGDGDIIIQWSETEIE